MAQKDEENSSATKTVVAGGDADDPKPSEGEVVALDDAITKALDEQDDALNDETIAASPEAAEATAEAEEPEAEAEALDDQPEEAEKEPELAEPAIEAPGSWSEPDREVFAGLPRDAQRVIIRRQADLEKDYTRKREEVAALARSAEMATQVLRSAVGPTATPDMVAPMLQKYAAWDLALRGPQKVAAVKRLMSQFGINPDSLLDEDADGAGEQVDPVNQHLLNRMQRLEGERLQDLRTRQSDHVAQMERTADSFREARDGDGKLLHPYLDRVEEIMVRQVKSDQAAVQADPERKLQEIYDSACWEEPGVRAELIAAEMKKARPKTVKGKPEASKPPPRNIATKGANTSGRLPSDATLDEIIYDAQDRAGMH